MISLVKVTSENFHLFQPDILRIEKVSFPTPWSSAAFREEMRNPLSQVWIAQSSHRLVGYMCFWVFAGEIHLMNIAVDPEERGKGIGKFLLYEMIKFGRSKGVQMVWLEVRPSNKAARMLYEGAGFVEISRRPKYYTDNNEDAIVMALTLPSGGEEPDESKGNMQALDRK
jgi:[ribosomal protein S18]-alanine N-acetyltransferase